MGSPHSIDRLGDVSRYLLCRNIRHSTTNAIQHLKTGLPLGNNLLIHLNRYNGYHRLARTFHDDYLAPIVNTAKQI
jgi:hypothetical protein